MLFNISNALSIFFMFGIFIINLLRLSTFFSLKEIFLLVSEKLNSSEDVIVKELNNSQGNKEEIDGYYYPSSDLVYSVMRPSNTLNKIINDL